MPFDFTVGSKLLPAGPYQIVQVHNDLIEIQGLNNDVAVFSPSYWTETQSKNGTVLIFDKYGFDYFLRDVLGGTYTLNVNIPISKAEQRVRRRARKWETLSSN